MEKIMMKKSVLVLLLIMSLLFMIGCNKDEEVSTDDKVFTLEELNLDYSKGLAENGYYKDVVARDSVHLIDFDTIVVPKVVHEINDEKINQSIQGILHEYGTYSQVVDRGIMLGDKVNVDYIGTIDGEEFSDSNTNRKGKDLIIGITEIVGDFTEQLVGHAAGDVVEIEVTFPPYYPNTAIRGKTAIFVTTINTVESPNLPDLTDEFVRDVLGETYGVYTVAELKDNLRTYYEESEVNNYLYNILMENALVGFIPESVIAYEDEMERNAIRRSAAGAGVSVNSYLELGGFKNFDEYSKAILNDVQGIAVSNLIVQAAAEELNLVITEEIINDFFLEVRGEGDYSEIIDSLGMPFVNKSVLLEATISALRDYVKYEE